MTSRHSSLVYKISPMRGSNRIESEAKGIESGLDFKRWHKRMQTEHELRQRAGKAGFGIWKWCFKACTPCRMFDSISYDQKICGCCLKFKTFKSMGTLLIILAFIYMYMYSILREEILPGGTFFFLFVLFLSSYVVGYLMMYAGLPPMFGNLLAGIIFGNTPEKYLPPYERNELHRLAKFLEKSLLLVALIRTGLLLDLSRIKSRVSIILRLGTVPLGAEFITVFFITRILMDLPWEWCALQGSILIIVSLASVTSIMHKSIKAGYGEDKNLPTVLIAASAVNVLYGIFLYALSFSFIFPYGTVEAPVHVWMIIGEMVEQSLIGIIVGAVFGILLAFFPDKRHKEAAAVRILSIGIAALAISNFLWEMRMEAAGALGTLIMCVVAGNMWEELGWHDCGNPVQYFYTLLYYLGAPMGLSLIGYSLNFANSHAHEIGLSFAVILTGLLVREIACYLITLGKSYPTNSKEKIYICLAMFSKGTFQALLSFLVEFTARDKEYEHEFERVSDQEHSAQLKQTIIIAVLITTPLVCYSLTLLTPVLLSKPENLHESHDALPTVSNAQKPQETPKGQNSDTQKPKETPKGQNSDTQKPKETPKGQNSDTQKPKETPKQQNTK